MTALSVLSKISTNMKLRGPKITVLKILDKGERVETSQCDDVAESSNGGR